MSISIKKLKVYIQCLKNINNCLKPKKQSCFNLLKIIINDIDKFCIDSRIYGQYFDLPQIKNFKNINLYELINNYQKIIKNIEDDIIKLENELKRQNII
jgi:hypothetical protein